MVAGHVVNRSKDDGGDGDALVLQWCGITVVRELSLLLIALATAHTFLVASLLLMPSANEGNRHYQWLIALLHLPGVFPLRLGILFVARGFVRAQHGEYGAPGTSMRLLVDLSAMVPAVWHLLQARGTFDRPNPSSASSPGRGRFYPQPTLTLNELMRPDPNLRRDPQMGQFAAGVPMSKMEADPGQMTPVMTALAGVVVCVSSCLFDPHRLPYIMGLFPLCEGSLAW
jgi:hypothetical protein